jgi:hypothetical protein
MTDADIGAMVQGYLECQLWAGLDTSREDNSDNNPNYDENYDVADVSIEYVQHVTDELIDVVTQHPLAVRMYLNAREREGYDRNELFGHDFYLTREHHGAGFWDRGLGDLGEYLTKVAQTYGSAEMLYPNANGELA